MSDKMRWRHGDTNPVVAAVDSATVVEIGDLVWQDVDDAKPAWHCNQKDQRDEAEIQAKFVCNFLGVAMQRSRAGETEPIRVPTAGVFEFDCPSGTFELGDLVGAAVNARRSGVLSQCVKKVGEARQAIGRVAKRTPMASTSVLVDIHSAIMAPIVRSGV